MKLWVKTLCSFSCFSFTASSTGKAIRTLLRRLAVVGMFCFCGHIICLIKSQLTTVFADLNHGYQAKATPKHLKLIPFSLMSL